MQFPLTLQLSEVHVEAFFQASGDSNPLHRDPEYARRSQFGRPVVYGVAAVLLGLAQWAQGRPFRLLSLRADFRKPLFAGVAYDFHVSPAGDGFRLRIGKGTVAYTSIAFVAAAWQPESTAASGGDARATDADLDGGARPAKRAAAAEEPQTEARVERFSVAAAAWPALQQAFGLSPFQAPPGQLTALLWASYHVGMEMPGRQALFSELKLSFSNVGCQAGILELRLAQAVFDDRFNRYTLTGAGTGIEQLRIVAFRRPLPCNFPLHSLPRFPAGVQPLLSKTVFVSGATRGFGAALARMCSLAGARMALNYRGDPAAALALRDELRAAGGAAEVFHGDFNDERSVEQMAAAIAASFGSLDLIVNSAAPPIRELQFEEQSNAEILEFTAQNMAMTLAAVRHLLPLLADGGQFAQISSKYVALPVRGFSHYVAAKAAQEGLIRGLAQEFQNIDFTVVRLPRVLTDQTNLPVALDQPLPPGGVAQELIMALANRGDANFRLLAIAH